MGAVYNHCMTTPCARQQRVTTAAYSRFGMSTLAELMEQAKEHVHAKQNSPITD